MPNKKLIIPIVRIFVIQKMVDKREHDDNEKRLKAYQSSVQNVKPTTNSQKHCCWCCFQ